MQTSTGDYSLVRTSHGEHLCEIERFLLTWVFDDVLLGVQPSISRSFCNKKKPESSDVHVSCSGSHCLEGATFQHSWDDLDVYISSPFTLIHQVLLRIMLLTKLLGPGGSSVSTKRSGFSGWKTF